MRVKEELQSSCYGGEGRNAEQLLWGKGRTVEQLLGVEGRTAEQLL